MEEFNENLFNELEEELSPNDFAKLDYELVKAQEDINAEGITKGKDSPVIQMEIDQALDLILERYEQDYLEPISDIQPEDEDDLEEVVVEEVIEDQKDSPIDEIEEVDVDEDAEKKPWEYCGINPLMDDCNDCTSYVQCYDYLKLSAIIPFFVIDKYWKLLNHRHEKAILIYLARRANFSDKSNHFGRCWLTPEQLSEGTGISKNNIDKYTRELERLGLITRYTSKRTGGSGWESAPTQYTVTWFKRMHNRKIKANKLRKKK